MKKKDWYLRPHLEEPHFTCMHATQSKLIPKEAPHPVVSLAFAYIPTFPTVRYILHVEETEIAEVTPDLGYHHY
jgi:hypothetical protein